MFHFNNIFNFCFTSIQRKNCVSLWNSMIQFYLQFTSGFNSFCVMRWLSDISVDWLDSMMESDDFSEFSINFSGECFISINVSSSMVNPRKLWHSSSCSPIYIRNEKIIWNYLKVCTDLMLKCWKSGKSVLTVLCALGNRWQRLFISIWWVMIVLMQVLVCKHLFIRIFSRSIWHCRSITQFFGNWLVDQRIFFIQDVAFQYRAIAGIWVL